MMKHILAFGVAFAIVAPTEAAWAGSTPGNRLAAPFPSNATIYRPDCWLNSLNWSSPKPGHSPTIRSKS